MSTTPIVPIWSRFLDPYDWRARALPALLCLLPALVALLVVYPAAASWQGSLLTLLVSCGFVFMLSRVARDAGKRIQDRLFRDWDGAPTTQLLRHRNDHFDAHTTQALHARLRALTALNLPDVRTERDLPAAADEVYRAASLWLIKRTRDTERFPLLFKENINFGFHRNALGLRWVGVAIALAAIIVILLSAGVLSIDFPHYAGARWRALTVPMAAAIGFSVLMALVWTFAITAAAAKRTGFAYAERLLECADSLVPDTPAQ